MRAKGVFQDMIRTGEYITAANPWMSGRLESVARQLGFVVKAPAIIRRAPPWAKARSYYAGMSAKQLERIAAFTEAIIEAREAGRLGRKAEGKLLAPEVIRQKFGPRKPRVVPSKAKPLEQLRAVATSARELAITRRGGG